MGRVALTGGFYDAPSLSADAQRCLNLFPERNPDDAPYPYTYYLRPALKRLATAEGGQWRGLYLSGVGGLYGVCGPNVYLIDGAWNLTLIGQVGSTQGQVYFADNRLAVVLVDGSSSGYVIDPFTHEFQTISAGNGAFYGADRVRFVDTLFLFNRPGTNQWYISLSEVTPAMLTGGPVVSGTIVGGTGYADGVHLGVNLTGGTGTGVSADLTVAGGAVTAVDVTVGGDSYRVGDVLSAAGGDLGGAIATGSVTAPGSGYPDATYTGVPLTGGAGEGAAATVVVSGGAVTTVTITAAGANYLVGDVLGAAIASLGGAGGDFAYTVGTLAGSGSGFTYTLIEVGSSAFDPLDIAAKTGASDDLVTFEVLHREPWLFGARFETEVWYNAGTPDFTFARMPGVYIEHGCAASNSVACTDLFMFWLGKDRQGNAIAFIGENYMAVRISTFAIEAEWATYPVTNDAIGFVYQKRGHTFYQVTFPTADKTWVYDLAEKLWHEDAWCDGNGVEHRSRLNCCIFAFGTIVGGDFETGDLYEVSTDNWTDDGQPVVWRRGFPHLVEDGKRVSYQRFIARIAAGQTPGLLTSDAPQVSLRLSDTGGQSWGDPITQSIGSGGQYVTTPTWWRLGMARDRVFELFGEATPGLALSGAWIEAVPAGT